MGIVVGRLVEVLGEASPWPRAVDRRRAFHTTGALLSTSSSNGPSTSPWRASCRWRRGFVARELAAAAGHRGAARAGGDPRKHDRLPGAVPRRQTQRASPVALEESRLDCRAARRLRTLRTLRRSAWSSLSLSSLDRLPQVFNFHLTDTTPSQYCRCTTAPRGRRWRRCHPKAPRRRVGGSAETSPGNNTGGRLPRRRRGLRNRPAPRRPRESEQELGARRPQRRSRLRPQATPPGKTSVSRRIASAARAWRPQEPARHRVEHGEISSWFLAVRLSRATLPSITERRLRDRARPAPVSPARPRVLRPRRRLSRPPKLRRAASQRWEQVVRGPHRVLGGCGTAAVPLGCALPALNSALAATAIEHLLECDE